MTFVDVVFPAFLFIVGISIPFAIGRRLEKGEPLGKVWLHVLSRAPSACSSSGLLMVNARGRIHFARWSFESRHCGKC